MPQALLLARLRLLLLPDLVFPPGDESLLDGPPIQLGGGLLCRICDLWRSPARYNVVPGACWRLDGALLQGDLHMLSPCYEGAKLLGSQTRCMPGAAAWTGALRQTCRWMLGPKYADEQTPRQPPASSIPDVSDLCRSNINALSPLGHLRNGCLWGRQIRGLPCGGGGLQGLPDRGELVNVDGLS